MPRAAVLVQFFATIAVAAVLHWLNGLAGQTQPSGRSNGNHCPPAISTMDNKTQFFAAGLHKFCVELQQLATLAANLTQGSMNNNEFDIAAAAAAALQAYVATQKGTFAPYCSRLGITLP